jgi:iron-sulfur cluster assembly protein
VISLSERAVNELRRIVKDQDLPDGTVVRVGVKGGGCSGFSYSLGFDDTVHEDDQTGDTAGFRIVCDPKSFLYLNGTEVDFEESLMGRGFKFGNPNASKTCGCGESFSV